MIIAASPLHAQTLFSDDFNDGTITGWTDIGPEPMTESGGVFQTPSGTNTDSHYKVDAGAAWTDYIVSADVRNVDDDVAGITFRLQDSNNYYLFSQGFGDNDAWNLRLRKFVGGSATTIAGPIDNQGGAAGQVNSALTWYSLKVEVSGTSIKCYVDDVLKFDITDSTFASGTVGLWLESEKDSEFDNALVESGSIPLTMSAAANQAFFVGDPATAMSQITITDGTPALITAANDIRIRIPAGFGMTWNSTDTSAVIGGAASSKVASTVSYEDSDATLVLDVTSDFADSDVITVSGLGFANFTAASSAANLEVEVNNDDVVTATDDKTVSIGAPEFRSIGTTAGDLYSVGTASVTAGSRVVTFAGGAVLPSNVGLGDKLSIGGGGPTTLFSDSFSNGSTSGWTRISGDSMVESSGVFQTPSGQNTTTHYTIDAGAAWTDYTYEIGIRSRDNDNIGITARVQNSNNYYLLRQCFGETDDYDWDLQLLKVAGGSTTDLAPPIDNYGSSPGQVNDEQAWYTFKIELSGTSIKAYVDGVLKFDVTDSTYSTGTAGIWLDSDQDSEFDNALVTEGGASADHYVLSRDSDTQVTLQADAGTTLTNQSYTFERCYNTMQAWEDDNEGDLVTDKRRAVGVCYNDGPFTDRLVISGSTTDATYFMRLTVAPGERHNGIADSGARIDAGGGWAALDAIDVEDEYTRIEWLEITNVYDAGDGISFADSPAADNSTVSGIFVHGFWQNSNAAFRVAADNITIRNCLATGGSTFAARIESTGGAMIENCTFWGYAGSGHGVYGAGGSSVSVRNTISVDHGAGVDMYIETGGGATIPYFGYNMYSSYGGGFDPGSYAGNNQLPPQNLGYLFVDTATADLHLEPSGNRAGNTGLDLSGDFADDADGETRTGTWDMGADESRTGTEPAKPKILGWREVER